MLFELLAGGESSSFAKLLGHGEVVCSSLLPQGWVLILEEVPGKPFNDDMWMKLGEEGRAVIARKLRVAVGTLRKIGFFHGDATKGNVLYDPHTAGVCLLDFEHAQPNVYNFGIEDGPELYTIMGAPYFED